MTDEIEWKDLYEQAVADNEKLREQLTRIKLARFSLDALKYGFNSIVKNPYFWLGYFVAMVSMLLIGAYRSMKG